MIFLQKIENFFETVGDGTYDLAQLKRAGKYILIALGILTLLGSIALGIHLGMGFEKFGALLQSTKFTVAQAMEYIALPILGIIILGRAGSVFYRYNADLRRARGLRVEIDDLQPPIIIVPPHIVH